LEKEDLGEDALLLMPCGEEVVGEFGSSEMIDEIAFDI